MLLIGTVTAQDTQTREDPLSHLVKHVPLHKIGGIGHLATLEASPEIVRA